MAIFSQLDTLISVCAAKDSACWAVAAPRLLRHCPARRHILIVPAQDLPLFKAITPPAYEVIEEDDILGHRGKSYIEAALSPQKKAQANWYLQQFIKIEAARTAAPDALVLIWDADTVPLRPLSFIDEQGCILLYAGALIEKPYLAMARALFEIKNVPRNGFIAQNFACRAKTVQAFCAVIKARHGCHWIDAVLNIANQNPDMSLSEYECLGLFMHSQNPESWRRNWRSWERFGVSLLGSPEQLYGKREAFLAQFFDYISFENWDNGQKYSKRKITNQLYNWKKVLIRAWLKRLL